KSQTTPSNDDGVVSALHAKPLPALPAEDRASPCPRDLTALDHERATPPPLKVALWASRLTSLRRSPLILGLLPLDTEDEVCCPLGLTRGLDDHAVILLDAPHPTVDVASGCLERALDPCHAAQHRRGHLGHQFLDAVLMRAE